MRLADYVFIGLFAVQGLAIVYLYLMFIRERNDIWDQIRKLFRYLPGHKPDHSKIPVFEKRLQVLEENVKGMAAKNLATAEPSAGESNHTQSKGEEEGGAGSSAKSQQDKASLGHEQVLKPAVATLPKADPRIWVEKTTDGLMRLKRSDKPKDIYLEQEKEIFKLHLANMSVDELHNLTILYEDILDFPTGFGSVSKLEMEVYPEYEEKNGFFIFRKKGRIKIYQ